MTDKPTAPAAPRYSILEWHDASEKPKEYGDYLCQTLDRTQVLHWTEFFKAWSNDLGLVGATFVTRWAYLPTPGNAGAATVQEVDGNCGLHCPFWRYHDMGEPVTPSDYWCDLDDGDLHDCQLFHGPHVVRLSDAARARLDEVKQHEGDAP